MTTAALHVKLQYSLMLLFPHTLIVLTLVMVNCKGTQLQGTGEFRNVISYWESYHFILRFEEQFYMIDANLPTLTLSCQILRLPTIHNLPGRMR